MEEHLPLDSPIGVVYRVGGAISGIFLLVFGVLGFLSGGKFFSTQGHVVLGLHTNGMLSLISVIFGLVLLGGAVLGGNVAASLNTAVGCVLLVSGLLNLALIRSDANFLAFQMSNIIFSFAVGLVLLSCGLYGRVTGGDPRGARSTPGRPTDRPLGSRD